jgi:hypothetical protein
MGKNTGTGKSFRFTDEELALLARHTRRFGTQKAAIVAGLEAIDAAQANQPSDADLVRMLMDRLAVHAAVDIKPRRKRS